jgi:hypothetical protein
MSFLAAGMVFGTLINQSRKAVEVSTDFTTRAPPEPAQMLSTGVYRR